MKKTIFLIIAVLVCGASEGFSSNGDVATPPSVASGVCSGQVVNSNYQGYNGNYDYAENTRDATLTFDFNLSGGSGYGYSSNSYPYNSGPYKNYAGYNTSNAYPCSEQVTVDFCNTVVAKCTESNFYSSTCRNQFQIFLNSHAEIACSYNRFGLSGTLNALYLQNQVNALVQMGY